MNFFINEFHHKIAQDTNQGGNVHICTSHWTGQIVKRIDDQRNMGRWTGQKYRLKENRYLTVITAYRPCRYSKTHLLKATQTVHHQQTTLLEKQGFVDPDPRKIFIDDLIALVKEQERDPMNS
jgi:hypothetical protein